MEVQEKYGPATLIVDAVYCHDFADVEGIVFAAGHHGHYEAGSCIGHHQKR